MLPPPRADFGDATATAALRAVAAELDLASLCPGAPALAQQLMRTLLWHLDRLIDLQPALTRARAIAQVASEFQAAWVSEKGDWDAVRQLLHSLGDLPELGWEGLRGLLRRREWREAQRIAERLQHMPELVALVDRLGRSQRAPRTEPLPPPLAGPAGGDIGQVWVQTRLPDAPGELHGIRLSGRIESMLPSQAAMLRHPVLRKLWRARRAEARLLAYDSQAWLADLRPDPRAAPRQASVVAPPQALERGPIIVCLDTSGSMRGAPETIAKAVALMALRTAQAQGRGCRLIAFGGPGEVIERELAATPEGLTALLDLIGHAFDGGTDLQSPIEHAIARVHQARWASADLLLVSDGEFGCTPAMLDPLDRARASLGLRVQGVLVGDRETLGLMEVADAIHWVRDWRRHADGGEKSGFSPVHSKSLTALYFPNLLSERAARHRPG